MQPRRVAASSERLNSSLAIYGAAKWWFSTPWQTDYEYIVPGNWPKTSSFRLLYQRHSSYADCATELFKPSNDSATLLCTRKKCFGWGLRIFCEWHHKWSSFWAILAHVTWPRAQALGQSISLKFSLETRLESESLIDFPTFLVQKLWYKKNKFIYCLINQISLLLYIITFQPDTPDTPSSKVIKSSDCSLVSNKNFSEILPSNGLGPRPGEVRQRGLKGLQCWRHSQNIRTPNQKMFFSSAEQKTCHVFWAFEQLCTAFGTRVILAQIHVRSCCFWRENPRTAPGAKLLCRSRRS